MKTNNITPPEKLKKLPEEIKRAPEELQSKKNNEDTNTDEDDCLTLKSADLEFYRYLNFNNMFENADFHAMKPTNALYQQAVNLKFDHSRFKIRLNIGRNTMGNLRRMRKFAYVPKRFGAPRKNDQEQKVMNRLTNEN